MFEVSAWEGTNLKNLDLNLNIEVISFENWYQN
jgi:hypothetical protein